MELRNKKWTEEEFLKVRKQVLASWKTGSDPELDLDKAIAYLKKAVEGNIPIPFPLHTT